MKAGRQIYVQEDSIISVAKEERNVLITHLFYNSNDNTFAIVTADRSQYNYSFLGNIRMYKTGKLRLYNKIFSFCTPV